MTDRQPAVYVKDSRRISRVRSQPPVPRTNPQDPIQQQIVEQEDPVGMNPPSSLVLSTGLTNDGTTTWVEANWGAPVGNTTFLREYEIQVKREGATQTVFRTDSLSVRMEPAVAGDEYEFSVYNILLSGARSTQFATDTITAAADAVPPTDPTGLVAGFGFRTITAAWTDNTEQDMNFGAGSYRIQVSTDAGFSALVTNKTLTGTVTSITDLSPETNYWVRVAAIDAGGNQSTGWSNVENGTTTKIEGIDLQSVPPAVDRIHIGDAAIGTAQIENASITSAKIISVKAGQITTDTLYSNIITLGAERKARGTFTVSGGSGGDTLDWLRVNGVDIIAAPVAWLSSDDTTALGIGLAINSHGSSPNYTALWVGSAKTHIDAALVGPQYNGYQITYQTTGGMTLNIVSHMADGQDNGVLESENYEPNVSGFQLTGAGILDAQSGTFRGDIVGGTINIGTNAFTVDTSGNVAIGVNAFAVSSAGRVNVGSGALVIETDGRLWAGGADYTNAEWRVSSAGNMRVNGSSTVNGTQSVNGSIVVGAGGYVTLQGGTFRSDVGGQNRVVISDNVIKLYQASTQTCVIDGFSSQGNPFIQSQGTKNIGLRTSNGDVFIEARGAGNVLNLWAGQDAGTTGTVVMVAGAYEAARFQAGIGEAWNILHGVIDMRGVDPASANPHTGTADYRRIFVDIQAPIGGQDRRLWYSSVSSGSSRRNKYEEAPLAIGTTLSVLPKLGKTWYARYDPRDWTRDDGPQHYGLIAEDVAGVAPELAEWAVLDGDPRVRSADPVDINERGLIAFLWDRISDLEAAVYGLPVPPTPVAPPSPRPDPGPIREVPQHIKDSWSK